MRFLLAAALAVAPLLPAAAQGPLEHFTVMADGHPLAVWARRPTTPKGAILLVHGRTWSARPDFDLQVPGESRSVLANLAARGYAAYAVDLRGYGATPRDRSGWVTPNRAADDVDAVLAWIAARQQPVAPRPALLGWSVGSLVAQLAAQRHPGDLSALILYGYPGDPDAVYGPDPDSGRRAPRVPNDRESAAADFISPAVTSPATVKAYVDAAMAADPIFAEWRAGNQFNALNPARVTTPTLLLQGERDPASEVSLKAFFSRLGTSDRQRVTLMGGDHAALLEDTHPTFVDAIVAFLEHRKR